MSFSLDELIDPRQGEGGPPGSSFSFPTKFIDQVVLYYTVAQSFFGGIVIRRKV